jgi:RNA polymerase subunit RPABC4/transcription elongation factor Spt4
MAEWYYQVLGEIYGPVEEDELRQKVTSGELPPTTLVATSKNGPWEEAKETFGLALTDPISQEDPLSRGERFSATAAGSEEVPVAAVVSPEAGTTEMTKKSPLALRPCSDCGWMVSREASVCPRCGRIFHESSSVLTYHGEHPLSVMVFFGLLAVLFLLASPVLVFLLTAALTDLLHPSGEGSLGVPFVVTAFYIVSMIVCALLGGAVGKPRMAYVTGLLLGLFFGPLGVFVAYAIDKRPQCPHCGTRLNGLVRQCPLCHARLLWRVVPSWV